MRPQHRRRAGRIAVVALTVLATTASASAQGLLDRVKADANRPPASAAAPASTALDVERLVAAAADRGVLLQRTRPGQRSNANTNTMRWVGVGLLGLGGLLALNGALSTCGASIRDIGDGVSVSTSKCWGRAAVGGGIAAAGLFVMTR